MAQRISIERQGTLYDFYHFIVILKKRLKSLKNKLSSVEKRITALEKELAEMDHNILMDYDNTVADPTFFDGYHEKKESLNNLMEEWETLSNALE